MSLVGCSDSGSANSVTVSISQSPPASLAPGEQTSVAATVTNDTSNAGVDWTATCSSTSCGSFDPAHTASEATSVYTAPTTLSNGSPVTITATSTTDTAKTAKATVSISSSASNGISISFAVPPPQNLAVNASTALTAIVLNDSSNAGADWTLTCDTTDGCGVLSATHTTGEVFTTYTAPAAAPSGGTVTITATSTADSTKSVSAVLTITP